MKTSLLLLLGFAFPLLIHAQSLLPNGDFEQADPANPAKPAHWDLPDGLGVQWTNAPDNSGHGKAIRMNTAISEIDMNNQWVKVGITQWLFPHPKKNPIAESYGLSLYSDPVPLKPGQAYKIGFDYMSEGKTKGKLWFRAYVDREGNLHRLYEGVIDCASRGTWSHFTGTFNPTQHCPTVTQFKVMLFCYFPPGVCWFDNVTVAEDDAKKEPTPPSASDKTPVP